jgi:hypothetical protein
MNPDPANVSIRPAEGGFVITWLEVKTGEPPVPGHFGRMSVTSHEAVRATLKDALKLVESVLLQKEMLRKAGKLHPEDLPFMGGTQLFQPHGPPGIP